ncbi:F0F1 ATP synthase subunit B [Thermoanaerobacterium sp. RBIITD]|uniref:F0F1 ATP synthase subunit B n=1 Tax=Thermoanaerobacterium sp. RBIITD TaxID=1550240 RepID=UPI000BB85508|nr:F0F1 ATP synthase subunit B [Thermoanaerobacterium sp. RBIITD]SNX52947.1 F-type H+-transporting ATPase subunit b [Thermoanaerobacterium sp. RBIITD]
MSLINPYTFIFMIINLVVLYLILKIFLFKPVTKFMEERAQKIKNSLEEADKKVHEAYALKAQYEDILKNADNEGKEIIARAEKYAKEKADKIIEEANKEANSIIERAKEEAETEKIKAMHDLRVDLSHLIVEAASKAIGNINLNDDKIIDEVVKEAGASWNK